jgi:hypothetical protein
MARVYPGRATTTRADGTFALDRAPPGPHILAVCAPGHAERFVTVTAPASDLRITLPPSRTLRGRVTDLDGAGVPRRFVLALRAGALERGLAAFDRAYPDEDAWDAADERGAAVTDAEGRFEVAGLGDEAVDVLVSNDRDIVGELAGARPGERDALIVTHAPRSLRVDARAVDAATGEALDVAWLELVDDRGRWPASRVGLAGRLTAILAAEGTTPAARIIDATEGATIDLGVVPLRRGGGRVAVRARLPELPMRAAWVHIAQPATGVRVRGALRRERREDTWTSPPLEPGSVVVTLVVVDVDDRPRELATAAAYITEGQTLGVELR